MSACRLEVERGLSTPWLAVPGILIAFIVQGKHKLLLYCDLNLFFFFFFLVVQVCGASDSEEVPPNFIKLAKDAYTPDLIAASDCMLGV